MTADPYRRAVRTYEAVIDPLNRKLKQIGLAFCRPAPGAAVLDVGCGTGTQLALYRHAVDGATVSGVEPSPAMLAAARQRLGSAAGLVRAVGNRLPWRDASFDLALVTLVLHELSPETRAATLVEMARVTRSGGRLLVIDFHPGPYTGVQGRLLRAMITGIEILAGREHFTNQCQFIASGGVPAQAAALGLEVERTKVLGQGNVGVYLLAPHRAPGEASR